jgi:hypothetical protein
VRLKRYVFLGYEILCGAKSFEVTNELDFREGEIAKGGRV